MIIEEFEDKNGIVFIRPSTNCREEHKALFRHCEKKGLFVCSKRDYEQYLEALLANHGATIEIAEIGGTYKSRDGHTLVREDKKATTKTATSKKKTTTKKPKPKRR